MSNQIENYREFWPFYLREHSHPKNRKLHFIGTALVLLILVASLFNQQYLWMLSIPLVGYGFAWYGHFKIEKNKPATFKYPFWSLFSDFRMFFLWVFRKLDSELKEAGVRDI